MILFNRERHILTRKEVKTMLNPASAVKASPACTPKVLLQAKKEATMQASEKAMAWDKGPWDKGHWANRK